MTKAVHGTILYGSHDEKWLIVKDSRGRYIVKRKIGDEYADRASAETYGQAIDALLNLNAREYLALQAIKTA